jgi:phage-related protein
MISDMIFQKNVNIIYELLWLDQSNVRNISHSQMFKIHFFSLEVKARCDATL